MTRRRPRPPTATWAAWAACTKPGKPSLRYQKEWAGRIPLFCLRVFSRSMKRPARRRKINTRVGRRAARERVRELVSEHDDQVVLLIWGGRVLGWSLRRIAAALEGSRLPPAAGQDIRPGTGRPPPSRGSAGATAFPRIGQRRLPAGCSTLSEEKPAPAGRSRGQMQDLRGPRKLRPGLVRVAHPLEKRVGLPEPGRPRPRGRDPAESRRRWLARGVQPGREAVARRGGLHGRGGPRRGPGVRGHGTG